MITIYDAKETDFSGNGMAAIEPSECKIFNEINGDYSAELTHFHDTQGKWKYIQEQRILRIPTPEGRQLFRIYYVLHDGQFKQITAKARHIFYDLNDNFLEDVRPTETNGAGAMERISSDSQYAHPFNFGSDVSNISTAYYVRTNPVAALMGADNAIISRWGGELERNNFDVFLRSRIGSDHGVEIQYGKNMTAINMQYDTSKVATRIMPTGLSEDGQTVITLPEKYIDSQRIGIYPHPIVTHIHYPDIKVDAENGITINDVYDALRERANAEFSAGADLPETYGTVSFVDLSTTEQYKNRSALETVHLGDTVTVKNKEMGIDTKTRVISYAYEACKNQYISIEFGKIKPGISTVLDRISSVLQDEITIAKSDLQKAIDKATELLTSVLGGYVIKRRGEILIMDSEKPESAQKVWRWNLNGLGYSSSGIDGPYNLAITMDGKIVADFITAGVLNGNLLKAGSVKADKIDAKGLTVTDASGAETLKISPQGDVSLNVKSLSITGNQVATKGDVTSGLNGLQVGSRNYLLNSDKIYTNQSREFLQTHDLAPIFNTYGLGAWTLSFDLKCAKNHWVNVYCQNGNDFRYHIGVNQIQATTSFKRYSITFTPYLYASNVPKSMLAFFSEYDSGAYVTVKNLKLEKGTKATDWTPAPEDRSYLVNTLSPTQADGMWLGSDGRLYINATNITAGYLNASRIKSGTLLLGGSNGVNGNLKVEGNYADMYAESYNLNDTLYTSSLSFRNKSGTELFYVRPVKLGTLEQVQIGGRRAFYIRSLSENGSTAAELYLGGPKSMGTTGAIASISAPDGIELDGYIMASDSVRLENSKTIYGRTTGDVSQPMIGKSTSNHTIVGNGNQSGNTEIYSKSGGSISLCLGGTEKFRVDDSGAALYGSNTNIRSINGAPIKFYISGQLCGYIDKSGWHNA